MPRLRWPWRDAMTEVDGSFDPAFSPLVDAFGEMVAGGNERGAIAAVVAGRTVVDVWGGAADPRSNQPWRRNTLACCFSVTKAVFSLLAHVLIDRRQLRLEMPAAELWPEFAAGGKSGITILDFLTHRAGLPAVEGPVRPGDLYDCDRMERLLAASQPVVPAQGDPVYHNMTYGFLLGAVLSRAAGGSPVADLIENLVAGPLEADFRIGLGPADRSRAAWMTQENATSLVADSKGLDTLFERSMRFFAPDEDFNTDRWRAAVIGSGSGHVTALGIARLFSALAGDTILFSPKRRGEMLREHARSSTRDPILGVPIRYAQGFQLSLPPGLDFGPNPNTVGHWGAGGATGLADPDNLLSFGYVTGHMASGMGSSHRGRLLVARLYECLAN